MSERGGNGMARYATIIGTGRYLPDWKEVTNDELRARWDERFPGVVDKWEESTGILRRWYAPRDWATSDIAVRAAQAALDDAGVKPENVDLILLGTDTPDYITPATSVVVQHKLGAVNAGSFDIGCACASFPTGLSAAAGYIATNQAYRYVLVIGVYMMSKFADPMDPVAFIYGDGAGAAVLADDDEPGFVSSAFLADGSYYDYWGIFVGGTAEPVTHKAIDEGRHQVRRLKLYPPEVNHVGWPKIVRTMAERGKFALEDIDLVLFTQVRLPSIKVVMEDLGLPLSKTHWIMVDWGYTGSGCLAMCFDDARRKGKVKSGDLVLFVGSGVGYNQAGAAFRMP